MSEELIANMSLARLFVGKSISALSDRTAEAVVCNRFFAQCRREVLRAFPWPLASKSVPLVREADQTYPGWAYVYGYPQNCLRVWAVSDASGIRSTISYFGTRASRETYDQMMRFQMPFQVALKADHAGRVILSDMPSAYAFLTYDVTNTAVFTPDLMSVIAWRLAMEIAGPLKARRENQIDAQNQYLGWLGRASATAMNEGRDDIAPESESISCRY